MPTAAARKKSATKPVEPEVVEELEDEEVDDLEDLEEDEVAEAKPTTKKSAAADVTFGIRDLIALIKKETGEDTDPRSLRTLIRKMARETDRKGGPRVDREIKPGNRSRYDWSGPNDAEVRAIVEAFKGGELEAEKQAKLKALKEQKAAKTAAKKAAEAQEAEVDGDDEDEAPAPKKAAAKPAARRRKAAPAKAKVEVEEVEDDEELDFDEE